MAQYFLLLKVAKTTNPVKAFRIKDEEIQRPIRPFEAPPDQGLEWRLRIRHFRILE